MNAALPKTLASYIHHTGIRALDHLAETAPTPAEGATADAVQSVVNSWKAMTPAQKEDFVSRVAASVGEVITASALLPAGLKIGKKAVKSARKVLKRSAKTIRKNKKAAQKRAKTAKKKARPAPAKKRATTRNKRSLKPA